MMAILVVILVIMFVGAFPFWKHSRNWGYWPSIVLGFLILSIFFLELMGRL